ncbi:MAG: short chain dehydrogenase [Leptolyngbya sp.]|nr:MAG: short chain dehydrogenase [Leptolyngbya sp.]
MATFDFNGKVAIVTGASSGIGRETAIKFAGCGAKVVVADVNDELSEQTVRLIEAKGGEAFYCRCDVSQSDQVQHLVQETILRYGKLNMACNNAGVEGLQAVTTEQTEDNWDRVINTNLKGVWLCMKYEIPELLKAGGGAIANVSSIAGLIGFPGLPVYVASKHGVVGLTKTAALEFADRHVRVNAVCPGPIMTPMLQRLMESTPGFTEAITAGVPEKRIGEPEEVADSILFLCSDQAGYVTGQCLAVDGGWMAQ